MATHHLPLTPDPGTSGNVWYEPSSIVNTNDRYPDQILRFKDTATKDAAVITFEVPQNYVGNPAIVIIWAANATSGAVRWDVAYRAVADTESVDPSTDQETVASNETTPAIALTRKTSTLSLTAANFAAGKLVLMNLSRDGTNAGDTLAADAIVYGVLFQYTDV